MYFSPPNLNTFFFPKRAGVTGVQCRRHGGLRPGSRGAPWLRAGVTGVQCRGADFLRDGERLKAYIIDIVVRKK